MSIITLAEFKAFTNLYNSSTMADAAISALIPVVEIDYLNIRGIPFYTDTVTYLITSAILTEANTDLYTINDIVQGASIRGTVTTIDAEDLEVTLNANSTVAGTDDTVTIYPAGSKYIAALMIKYQFDVSNIDFTLKSESIEKHSWTVAGGQDLQFGYPKIVTQSIKRFGGLKTGTITMEGFIKGREEITKYNNRTTEDYYPNNFRNIEGS